MGNKEKNWRGHIWSQLTAQNSLMTYKNFEKIDIPSRKHSGIAIRVQKGNGLDITRLTTTEGCSFCCSQELDREEELEEKQQ